MRTHSKRRAAQFRMLTLCALCGLAAACGGPDVVADGGAQDASSTDAGSDGGADAGSDAGATQDAGSDAGAGVNDTCANASVLTPGVVLTGLDTRTGGDDYQFGPGTPPACSELDALSYSGRDLAYGVSVPSGQTLTITVTPSFIPTTWDPAVALVTDCASVKSSCLAASDIINSFAKPETVTWTNAAGNAQQVFVIVDSYTASDPGGHFSILASVQ